MRFTNQVVWITGASSGIGEALAMGFAREGARLVLSSRRATELERVRATCVQLEKHLILPLDLTQGDTFAAARDEVLRQCGRIDLLVNNGGVSQRGLAADGREEATFGMGGPEIFAIYLKRWVPWLVSRVVRRMKFVTGNS
jgi:NADP-dependent 3-hydroxy acid dehydrogenase YdfG